MLMGKAMNSSVMQMPFLQERVKNVPFPKEPPPSPTIFFNTIEKKEVRNIFPI